MRSPLHRGRSQPAAVVRPAGRVWVVLLTAFLALGAALSAHAQPEEDPPGRAARLSEFEGQVWLSSPDSDEWISAVRNRPLTSGDRIATDAGARAEITLGTTTLRLDGGTELEIERLDDSRYHVYLGRGSVAARVRNPQSLAEFELTTDEGLFRLQAIGRYRFDRADQRSAATVLAGQAIYEAGNTALPVQAGQLAQFWVDPAGAPQYAMAAPARDDFASWNGERDRAEDRIATTRFVSPEMTGAEDLDRYGEWQQTPDYGTLWVPHSVPVGWAPYSAGHWAWVRPWGWTWVDDAPWGFAPFHYGRWVYHRNAWCWAPGTYVARPIYAPALVAWVGGSRANVSISIGGGAPIGWFPLAPREVYVPGYRSSPRYLRELNRTHVTDVSRITAVVNSRSDDRRDFANRKHPHAVNFVPVEVLTRRQPVGPAADRFRTDPRLRAWVAEARPTAPVLAAPPIAAPAMTRSPRDRSAMRPPGADRWPGISPGPVVRDGDRGRREDARPEFARPDSARRDGSHPELVRPEAMPVEGRRPRFAGPDGRPDFGRGGDRPPSLQPPSARGGTWREAGPAPVAPVQPPLGAAAAAGVTPTQPGPHVNGRGVTENSWSRPVLRAPGRGERAVAVEPIAPARTAPLGPVQRITPVAPRPEIGTTRAAQVAPPPPAVVPPAAVAPPATVAAPATVAPPALSAPPSVVQRAPEARLPEARAAEAQRRGGDGRMTRPEPPRGRGEERR